MVFFIDENIPTRVKEYLEAAGFLVLDIRKTGMEGIDDRQIFNLAVENCATFLTTDKDFFHTIHA
jgi:predicted nuclease of predicted toxin-antitoxin system